MWPRPGAPFPVAGYHFAHGEGHGVLWPVREATIQDGTIVDWYGDPDLFAAFAREYLKQYWVLFQPVRLPQTLVEGMPSLLPVTAAELILKAFLLRSTGEQPQVHDLVRLYDGLKPEHQAAVNERFSRCQLVASLTSIGADPPAVEQILDAYSDIYGGDGGRRGAYQEAKFYAEPTTMLPGSSSRGDNVVKGSTPYPTFMPFLVEAIVESYDYCSGVERLRRRGAHISERGPDSTSHGQGESTLRPSSLGLAVVMVAQQESRDSNHEDLPAFASFKCHHPSGFQADRMYGGSTLFDDAAGSQARDGVETIADVECRVISGEGVGFHARYLERLADRLEAIDAGGTPLGVPPSLR